MMYFYLISSPFPIVRPVVDFQVLSFREGPAFLSHTARALRPMNMSE